MLTRHGFWREAFALNGSVTPHVLPRVIIFGAISLVVCMASNLIERLFSISLAIEVAPYEFAGAALGLLLVLRTNAGYDRWWEARKIWGGIVNQSRNLAISGVTYSENDRAWRERFARWAATFPHIARTSLRKEPVSEELEELLGTEDFKRLQSVNHAPSFVAAELAGLLRLARNKGIVDEFSFLQIDKERAQLIDHIGACERILATPLAAVYGIKIRRFITLFLVTMPFALLHRITGGDLLIPLITMFIAYPLLSLDQIGIELQNPFAKENLSHLPIGHLSKMIEGNVKEILNFSQPDANLKREIEPTPRLNSA